MAKSTHRGLTVAIVGGGAALAAWILSRSKGWGSPGRPGAHAAGDTTRPARCVVWIRPEGLTVDGVAADLPTVIARCRAAGEAEVNATGDALTGAIWTTLKALRAAGVRIYTAANLEHAVNSEPRS